jgi:hypothetical protein
MHDNRVSKFTRVPQAEYDSIMRKMDHKDKEKLRKKRKTEREARRKSRAK